MPSKSTTPKPNDKPQKQCAKCPWRKITNPREIPKGYSENKHRRLERTISKNLLDFVGAPVMRIMACHESDVPNERVCVGWLHNQLGVGNNIALRIAVFEKRISANYKIVGEQHECFDETLPACSEE